MSNKVYLVVLNYNDSKNTLFFVEKIQSYKSIDTIVVVDNFSTDNSYDDLLKIGSEKVKVIRSAKNGGYAYGNNFGIKYIRQNLDDKGYVIISNPDVYFTEETVKAMKNVLDKEPQAGLVAPRMCNADGTESKTIAWKLPNLRDDVIYSITILNKLLQRKLAYTNDDLKGDLAYVDVLPGSFFMTTLQVFQDIDYFDESTFLYCEERILSYKLKSKRYQCILLNNQSYIHKHGVTINKTLSYIKKYQILQKSRRIYLEKYLKINAAQLALFNLITFIGTIEKVVLIGGKNLIYQITRHESRA